MKNNPDKNNKPQKKPVRGSRPMLVIGIILLNISLFLASFVLAFNMIVNPIGQRDEEVRTLTEENVKLKSDAQLLKDQLDVTQSELESYKSKNSSSGSYNYSNYLNDESNFIRSGESAPSDAEDTEDTEEGTSSARSMNREDDEMNMDGDR